VKFLVDNQLPLSLAKYLRKQGHDCQHVWEIGLATALDVEICRYADSQERVIISKDEDFLYLANRPESKTRFLWVRIGNCRTVTLLAAFERFWPVIESALNIGDRVIELR
jgi:predicted nuclease of predicted toxin-antitoxin system